MRSALAEKIKTHMDHKTLNISQLEKRAGLKTSAVYNILSGKTKNPTAETLIAIAHVLECSVDELLGLRVPRSSESPKPKKEIIVHNFALFQMCVDFMRHSCEKSKISPPMEKGLEYIQELYDYCSKNHQDTLDDRFANWLFERSFEEELS